MNGGSYWRGRRMYYDPDHSLLEQERQRWVTEKLAENNEVIEQLTVDPDLAYRQWRDNFVQTGSPYALDMMLEYVR